MNKKTGLINPHFELVVLWIQSNIGKAIVTLLILAYLGTALMITFSLQHALAVFGPTPSWIVAGVMAVLSQAIRGTLVYFNQANPYRISSAWEWMGVLFAIMLTILACVEIYHLFSSQGIGTAAKISAIGLIIAGFFLEVYFLSEINRANRAVLVSNEQLMKDAIDFEKNFAELKIKISEAQIELINYKRDRMSHALQKGRNGAATPPVDDELHRKSRAESVFDLSGEEHSFSANGHYEGN